MIAFNASGGGAKDLMPRDDLANPVTGSNGDPGAIAYAIQERAVSENPAEGPQGAGWKQEEAYTLEARHHAQMVATSGVRRLTPRECERLQGLPDDWTLLDEKTPDSRRYSALGDAVTANVAEWIGRRLVTELVA